MMKSPADIAMARLVTLWGTYTAAAQNAQASGRIDDGIAAGRAWAAWLEASAEVDQPTTARSTTTKDRAR